MLVDLTMMSAADDRTLSRISRIFYFNDAERRNPNNPDLRKQFHFTSAWRDPAILEGKLAFVKGMANGQDRPVQRLDIVGHSISDRDTKEVVGLAMDDQSPPSVSTSKPTSSSVKRALRQRWPSVWMT